MGLTFPLIKLSGIRVADSKHLFIHSFLSLCELSLGCGCKMLFIIYIASTLLALSHSSQNIELNGTAAFVAIRTQLAELK